MQMLNIKITLSYNGANYKGFAYQKNANTIQGELETAAKKIFKEKIIILGASRTDAGVNALEQTANFKIKNLPSTISLAKLPFIFNAYLPENIVVSSARKVSLNFHSRFSAKKKLYIYLLFNNRLPNPFVSKFCYAYYFQNLNLEYMQKIAQKYFVGEKNFAAFGNYGSSQKSTICNLEKILIFKNGNLIIFSFLGNRFLYKMIRNLVGVLIDIGRGKLTEIQLKKIIKEKDRKKNKIQVVTSKGLFLVKVYY